MKLLTKEQMQQLTTKRLLAYKNSLMKVPETPDWDKSERLTKISPEWKKTYFVLKDVLATRENIQND